MTNADAQLVRPGPTPGEDVVEGWMPYRAVFDTLWSGRRHVVMGAAQLDGFGNQNISAIGDPDRPTVQLLGVRGAPGNTLNHATSYWVGNHSVRVFVDAVDVVCGVGTARAAALPEAARRFHDLRQVVTNLCVMDFQTPDGRMRLCSVHPGVWVEEVVGRSGFALHIPAAVPTTRAPSSVELAWIRDVLDPEGRSRGLVAA